MRPHSICDSCLEKQRRIDQLLEENSRLKAQLHYRDKKQNEGFFGSSTPSAQRPAKPNTDSDKQSKRGGQPQGHPGPGRKGFPPTKRLYQWVKDRAVPPENNRAERELRPTVIARKVSFGSQSEAGAQTRETLMSLLHTLKRATAGCRAVLQIGSGSSGRRHQTESGCSAISRFQLNHTCPHVSENPLKKRRPLPAT